MKKKISFIIFFLIVFIATNVFAASVTMEIVEDNICTINLNEKAKFEKKIISSNLENKQVTLQLKVSNNSKEEIPTGELMLVIDSSESMNIEIESGKTTRKDLVLNSAKSLVENLLKLNNSTLKIGVVTFSTGSEKSEDGFIITGTEADAQKVCDFTNNVDELTSKISAIEGTGQYTNLDSGIQLAKQSFSSNDVNKYMIILTDGLPNLAIGHNDLVSYEGLTDVITKTKSNLSSLAGINVITMLTGIENEEAIFREGNDVNYTYGQVIQEVFGTESTPTIGKFYKIDDSEIEKTITENIYNDLVPKTFYLRNIHIVDYFPQYIVDNFELSYVEGIDVSNVSATIDSETNSISWMIKGLGPEESAIIQYNLKLKNNFDEKIIEKILNTNQKVDINYTDFDNTEKTKSSDITPKLKLTAIPEPPIDNTTSDKPLPETGSPILIIGFILLGISSIFFAYKSRKIK